MADIGMGAFLHQNGWRLLALDAEQLKPGDLVVTVDREQDGSASLTVLRKVK